MTSSPETLKVIRFLLKIKRPLYGYEIAKALKINVRNVYNILHRLEKKGLLQSKLKPSSIGPKRTYYSVPNSRKLSKIAMDMQKEQNRAKVINFILNTDEVYAYQIYKSTKVNVGTIVRVLKNLHKKDLLEMRTETLNTDGTGPARVFYRVRPERREKLRQMVESSHN